MTETVPDRPDVDPHSLSTWKNESPQPSPSPDQGVDPALGGPGEPAQRTGHDLLVRDLGGVGRPVVLIHGWPLSSESWSAQEAVLAEAGFRVIVYDRRGFGRSDPGDLYDYDTLADDLANILNDVDLRDVTLVGFSMGGGEVARYISRYGQDRLHSAVFAAAVTPFLLRTDGNPDGPLTEDAAAEMRAGLEKDRDAFFEDFTTAFFSVGGELKVSEEKRRAAVEMCRQSDQGAALGCMEAFGTTDFRTDLRSVNIPTLVIHGDGDAIVPVEGSGQLTFEAIRTSELVVLRDAPHGCNVSHPEAFNVALLEFLKQ